MIALINPIVPIEIKSSTPTPVLSNSLPSQSTLSGSSMDTSALVLLLSDILGTEEDIIYRDLEEEVEKSMLNKAIGKLSERERIIVDLRYGLSSMDGEEKTQKEVADLLGISQSYISRLEKKIMKRLKKELVKNS